MQWIEDILIRFPTLGFALYVGWYIVALVICVGVAFVCLVVVLFFTTCHDIKLASVKTAKMLFKNTD